MTFIYIIPYYVMTLILYFGYHRALSLASYFMCESNNISEVEAFYYLSGSLINEILLIPTGYEACVGSEYHIVIV